MGKDEDIRPLRLGGLIVSGIGRHLQIKSTTEVIPSWIKDFVFATTSSRVDNDVIKAIH
jgi:hypothetical protein